MSRGQETVGVMRCFGHEFAILKIPGCNKMATLAVKLS